MTEKPPRKPKRLQTAGFHDAIRVFFALRCSDARLMYDSRMDDDAPIWKAKVSEVYQTISGCADGVTVKKSLLSDREDLGEAERFFAGKRMYVHIKECPRTQLEERWPYSIVLNAIQNEYRPTFHWRLDDRSLFTRLSMAALNQSKLTFEVRLRDTDLFFRELRLSGSQKSMTLLPLLGIRFWYR